VSARVRWIVVASIATAIAVFLVVQDRITAAGARDYVARQRAAAAGQGPAVTIDEVMRPAVARSVRAGVLWGGVVLAIGVAAATAAAHLEGRRGNRSGN
jgi:hypothetical protein